VNVTVIPTSGEDGLATGAVVARRAATVRVLDAVALTALASVTVTPIVKPPAGDAAVKVWVTDPVAEVALSDPSPKLHV